VKLAASTVVLVFGPWAAVLTVALAQTIPTTPSPPPSIPLLAIAPTNLAATPLLPLVQSATLSIQAPAQSYVRIWPAVGQTNAYRLAPLSPQIILQAQFSPDPPARPKPGIYETAPYTSIIVVPGPHPDDRAIVPLGGPGTAIPSIPTIQPELRLIPRDKPQK